MYPCRDEKGLGCPQEMTVAAKYSYFSTLKNVSRTWFRRPIRDWIFRVLGLICPCLDGRILPAEELLSCCDASALFEKTNKQTNNIVLNTQAGCHASVWQKLLRPKEGDFVTRRQGMRSNGECTFQHSWSFLLFLTGAMTPSKWLISNTPVLKSKLPAG